jgi:chemotaxis protein MotB
MEENIGIKENDLDVTVSFPDHILFASGNVKLKEVALPILDRFRETLEEVPHRVLVVGHTDNVSISNLKFTSNWDLSAAKAAVVVRYLLRMNSISSERLMAVGRADSVPIAPNDSSENQAKNRRIEFIFQK